jgi:glyoxylase-like metal-dependent hydrolase (beta-lactamase superfamily II)/rhodanese-related sulfurtransferase
MSKLVNVETLQRWLSEGNPVSVVDVRSEEQRQEWWIPGSVHIDAYSKLTTGNENALTGLKLPKDRPIVTVCAAGNTSRIAAEQLEKRGFEAASLEGGMKAWSLAWNTAELSLPNGVRIIQVRRTGKGCLSYLVFSGTEALVIDPALDPEVYQRLELEQGIRIIGVLETHVHADHLSRAHHLAAARAVPRYLPAQERVACQFTPVNDGDEIPFGRAKLKVIHTPGHTWESSAYSVDGAVFTGDTLFTDGVGRPDLEANPEEAAQRASALYDSLQRLLHLPEDTLVLPGHTSEPSDFSGIPVAGTLREVKAAARLLRLEKAAFIGQLTASLPEPPANHQHIVELNEGCELPAETTELEAGANRCAIR